VLVPERRTGVVILANSNTVPTSYLASAVLDIALADPAQSVVAGVTPAELGEGVAAMRALLPPVVGPVAEALSTSGPDAAAEVFRQLTAAVPAGFDLDDDGFIDAVWGAIELHLDPENDEDAMIMSNLPSAGLDELWCSSRWAAQVAT
jgi:hypothetical protein